MEVNKSDELVMFLSDNSYWAKRAATHHPLVLNLSYHICSTQVVVHARTPICLNGPLGRKSDARAEADPDRENRSTD